ncbi:Tol-Pal system protein TolB [Paenibacillus auburnensis]|uniref:Tol-Pal system protein TolB n=1 Tax=Paenibacillus auburnensis TaxID=2905649 RepID=A0ABN8GKD9_9BACL|nr:stalk domain-containing protein [Paenibacillus auburnensis]CAH1211349.1 Tol-Pal system protein TolB [Paenibacillus auburnensis]
MRNSKWFGAALASALLVTGGAGSIVATSSNVSAAAVNTSAVKTAKATWKVNSLPVAFSTIDSSGYKLYSLSEVAGELGAKVILSSNGFELNDSKGLHTVQLQADAKSYLVDGVSQQFTVAPVLYNGKVYVELTKLVTALGGELTAEDQSILSFARPEGQFDTLHWNADGSIIANRSDSETAQLLKFSAFPGVYDIFSSNESALDFAVSPDQKWGAFTDDKGQLNLINLSSGAISPLGTDTSVKMDLVWSQDGKTIYFIQGDKQEKIGQISVDTGAVKTLLEDKVENKSELRLSADAKSVVYIVNVTGVAKNDADSTEDSLTVDFSKAGEQLYKLDLSTKDAKPAALTTALDNKLYPEILANGTVAYLSADPDGNAANTLKSIGADGAITNIALDVEPSWTTGVTTGLIVSGTAADGSTTIYSIDANGSKTSLFHTTEDVSEVAVSHDGSKLAIVSDGKVLLIQNGQALQLTK